MVPAGWGVSRYTERKSAVPKAMAWASCALTVAPEPPQTHSAHPARGLDSITNNLRESETRELNARLGARRDSRLR